MTCSEIAALSPLYLSGELDPRRTAGFSAHLDACPSCSSEIARLVELDLRLRHELLTDEPDTRALDRRIAARVRPRILPRANSIAIAAIAAAVVLLISAFAYRAFGPAAPVSFKQVYLDAAADHRREVVDQQPRVWRSDASGVASLAARQGISSSLANLLAPAGYHLERARLCTLSGHVYLHLVYSDGAHEVSLFLRQRDPSTRGEATDLRKADAAGEHLVSFDTARVSAIVVTGESGDSARRLAQAAALSL